MNASSVSMSCLNISLTTSPARLADLLTVPGQGRAAATWPNLDCPVPRSVMMMVTTANPCWFAVIL